MPAPRGVFTGLCSFLVAVASLAATVSPGYAVTPVSWPPATGPVLAEVVTGGASASDEYIEIANAASDPVDLDGLELVYVTASGSTVMRKASFASPSPLAPGQHILLANGAGIYGPLADVTYSSGIAADGGSLVLRHVGGSVVDAVGWGTATNSFVEGSVAPAPPVSSSIERRPGGTGGNWLDTNDNGSDWLVQPSPIPQSLSSAPRPRASDAPPTAGGSEPAGPTPTVVGPPSVADDTATPESMATPEPTATASASAATTPAAAATPSAAATPTAVATERPPSSSPAPTPTASPSLSSSPPAQTCAIADARALADGTATTVEGVLTTRLAVLESGRGGFVQDSTGGVAIYLPQVPVVPLPAGTWVRVSGTLDDRYGQRTIRVDDGGLAALGEAPPPEPRQRATGGMGGADAGVTVSASGTVTASPDSLADGLGIWIDDGSGPLRVVVTPSAVGERAIVKGSGVMVSGPLGQRVSGSSPGYRVEVTEPGSIVVLADPSPSASASALPSEPADGSPRSTATPSPTPSAAEPEPDLESIAIARTQPAGTNVHLAGVVTVAPGIVGTPELLAIADSSGGVFVRLAGQIEGLELGRSVEVVGVLAAPYGQLEVRELRGLSLGSQGEGLAPMSVSLPEIGEPIEGSLVSIRGTVDSVTTDSGRLTLAVGDGSVDVRVLADPSTGLTRTDVARGDLVELTGVVGQRASASGRADGYRLWLRGRSDLVVLPEETPPAGESSPSPSGTAVRHDLASALGDRGSSVDVEATVTAPAGLFDLGGPTITVDDGTAAVAAILPSGADGPRVGSRIRLVGRVGRWEGGPTVVASRIVLEDELQATQPLAVTGALGPALEWRLVRVCGRIDKLTRAGSRWRAELLVDGQHVIVLGEPAAGVSATGLTAGRMAVVTGIVRRSTSDSSAFQLLPRSSLDVRLGPAPETLSALGAVSHGSPAAGTSGSASAVAASPRVDISALAGHVGESVTISGLVVDSDGERATVDDGTGNVRIGGSGAKEAIALLEPGDAIEVSGVVAQDEAGLIVSVDPLTMITLSGDGSDDQAVTAPAIGLRVADSPDTRAMAGAASVHGGSSDGPGALGTVGAILLALLSAAVAVAAAARLAGNRTGSFVPMLLAAGRRTREKSRLAVHLPRPGGLKLRLGTPCGPRWTLRPQREMEVAGPSKRPSEEVLGADEAALTPDSRFDRA
jgi:uncharacterized protein YdeI (BOF family)